MRRRGGERTEQEEEDKEKAARLYILFVAQFQEKFTLSKKSVRGSHSTLLYKSAEGAANFRYLALMCCKIYNTSIVLDNCVIKCARDLGRISTTVFACLHEHSAIWIHSSATTLFDLLTLANSSLLILLTSKVV